MGLLSSLGLDPAVLAAEDPEGAYAPGRVVEEQKNSYRIMTTDGPVWARPSGRLLHEALGRLDLPAVGDFVLVRRQAPAEGGWTQIERLLPRRSYLARKAVGGPTAEQVIAANVDFVFVVTSLNLDLSERRLERYLLAAWDGGAVPVVLLSKADLATSREDMVGRAAAVAMGAKVLVASAVTGEGMAEVRALLAPGKTAVFVGSSGVGKSTLINGLTQTSELATQAVREDDDKGRHTTTARSLWLIPGGGVVIDTPGMREFMPWADEAAVDHAFGDVEELQTKCRYSNCRHGNEPGCAVAAAVAAGELEAERFASYEKLQKEQAYLARKQDARLAAVERGKWKKISIAQRRGKGGR